MAELLASGATTRVRRSDAALRLAAAEAMVDKAEADLASAAKLLDDTVLRAPAAGIVTDRAVEVGLVIGPERTAFELAAGPKYEAVFQIAEVVLTQNRDARPTVVRISPIDGGDPVDGHIREVAPVVDVAQGTVTVRVAIEGEPPGLALGASVIGEVILPVLAEIRLPLSALGRDAAGPMVWVRDPQSGKVSARAVQIRRFVADTVVIGAGLSAGEEVVSRGAHLLYDGKTTEVVSAPEG